MENKAKLSDYAHDKLKELILDNTFKPGQHLEEVSLCELLKISRTPLREAINRLVNEKLLVAVPQKGIFVPELTIQDVVEIFKARKTIEPIVIMLSAASLDKTVILNFKKKTLEILKEKNPNPKSIHELDYQFHDYINKNCGNRYIYQHTSYISELFQRVRTQDFYPLERAINGAREHLEIMDSIISGKFDDLSALMLNHIKSTERYYYKRILEEDEVVKDKNIRFVSDHLKDLL